MSTHQFLLLDDQGLHTYCKISGQLQPGTRFDATPEGIQEFRSGLQTAQAQSLTLLVNLPEEAFQLESLPHLNRRDRQTLIERRLTRHYFGIPYTLTHPLRRQEKSPREEQVLLTALTAPDRLSPWLEVIQASARTLKGIYSLPQLIPLLVKKLPGERQLIVTRHPFGLRETLVSRGELLFSRLHPLDDGTLGTLPEEINRLRHYLVSQRWLPRDTPLETWLLLPPDPNQDGISSLHFLELAQVAQELGYSGRLPEGHADLLCLHLLASHPPRHSFNGLAPAPSRKRYRDQLVPGGLALLAGSILLVWGWVQQEQFQIQTRQLQTTIQALQQVSFPTPMTERERQRRQRLADFHRGFASPGKNLILAMDRLSLALEQVTEVRLEELLWQASEGKENLLLSGQLPSDELRVQAEIFARLLTALAQQGSQIEIISRPPVADSDQALRGGDREITLPATPVFRLRLSWPPTP